MMAEKVKNICIFPSCTHCSCTRTGAGWAENQRMGFFL